MEHFPLVTAVFIPFTEETCPFTSRPTCSDVKPFPYPSRYWRDFLFCFCFLYCNYRKVHKIILSDYKIYYLAHFASPLELVAPPGEFYCGTDPRLWNKNNCIMPFSLPPPSEINLWSYGCLFLAEGSHNVSREGKGSDFKALTLDFLL